jgi:tagatose-6-phosphate ketose/aldose isomerase
MENLLLENYLDKNLGGMNTTSAEISLQPVLWQETWESLRLHEKELKKFLDHVYSIKNINIILTGAGTSAFIGDALQGTFQKHTGIPTRSISSTNLVTNPDLFLLEDRPTLLISFARSGDSPESVAVVNLVDKICSVDYHLVITCNPSGKLASESHKPNRKVFLLPEKTNDKGLAMTASFTNMLLSGALIARIRQLDTLRPQISRLVSYGEHILKDYSDALHKVAKMDFKRAVFLGSGTLLGIARESQLKVQELTNGMIICKHDSFLGFRHGPKAVIDNKTLVMYLFSNNTYVGQYEDDLVKEICSQELGMYSIGVLEKTKKSFCLDLNIILSDEKEPLDEDLLSICYILPAQILGYYKSVELGFNPDNPSATGVISRVVQGVKIYPYD